MYAAAEGAGECEPNTGGSGVGAHLGGSTLQTDWNPCGEMYDSVGYHLAFYDSALQKAGRVLS